MNGVSNMDGEDNLVTIGYLLRAQEERLDRIEKKIDSNALLPLFLESINIDVDKLNAMCDQIDAEVIRLGGIGK